MAISARLKYTLQRALIFHFVFFSISFSLSMAAVLGDDRIISWLSLLLLLGLFRPESRRDTLARSVGGKNIKPRARQAFRARPSWVHTTESDQLS